MRTSLYNAFIYRLRQSRGKEYSKAKNKGKQTHISWTPVCPGCRGLHVRTSGGVYYF